MSAIEWTEATWNPVTGCTKVSPGLRALLRGDVRGAVARRRRAIRTSRASTCGSGRSASSSRCAGAAAA